LVSVSLGRTTLDDINHPVTGDLIVKAGSMIDEAQVVDIEAAGIQSVRSARR
jgi:DNA-directed RNA polymerase subunit beta'